jgi:hypothetical protein
MSHEELRRSIDSQRQPSDCFIKWWGRDPALFDYELLGRFLEKGEAVGEVAGFSLLSLDAMWQAFVELNPDLLSRELQGGEELIMWAWQDRGGKEHLATFPYTPEGLMELMESDFFD